MNLHILISFLLFNSGPCLGVQYDQGAWKPMTKVPGAPTRKVHDPKNVQGPRRQNVERIQDNLVVSENAQIRRKIVPSNPDKNDHNHMSQSKKEKIINTNVATDRVGQFFSKPHRPVKINLQQSIQRPHQGPPQSHRISFNRNVNINHPSNRILPQHQTAPQNQRKVVQPSPTIHRTSHNNMKSNNHQYTSRPRHDQMFSQLKASTQQTEITTSTSKKVSETTNSQQTKSNNNQPILLNFEDFEDQAKTAKPRFIDPEEIENFGHDQSEHHNNSTEHMGDHAGEHEGRNNYNSSESQDDNPHGDQQFCVDISEYLDLKWVIKDSEECHVTFTSQCETKSENVCIDVTETKCEVVPYKECKMGLEPMEYTEKKLAPKLFVEKSCYEGKKTIPHKKHFPECHNVTKQNCVTLWETDDDGEQIWAGTEQCEPVTWQECELIEKEVKFIVPEVTCADKQELWYHEPEPTQGSQMTNTFTCEINKSSHCSTQTRPDCKQITWNECREVPVSNCKAKKVHVPTQELLHRKKCLLPDDVALTSGIGDGYGTPRGDPLSSYGN